MANLVGSKFTARVQQQAASLIRAIERIHEEENDVYVVRADNISRENDRLRKELYDLQQRITVLTERLGPDNLADIVQKHKAAVAKIESLTVELTSTKGQLAHEQASRVEEQQLLESMKADLARRKQTNTEAQAESELNREALGRLKLELQAEWQKTSKLESTLSSLRKENERLTSECEDLKSSIAKDRVQRYSLAPETPSRGPAGAEGNRANAVISDNQPQTEAGLDNLPLEAQVAHMRRQYDELLASKLRLSEKYARDLAEWKSFKEKYRTSTGGNDIVVTPEGIKVRRRVAKHAKDSPTPTKRAANARLAPLTTADDGVFIKEESPFPLDMPPVQSLQFNPPPVAPAAQTQSPATSNTDTQDSQPPPPAGQADGQGSRGNPPLLGNVKQKIATRPDIASIKQGSQSDDEGNLSLRRFNHTPAPLARSLSSPAESPHRPKSTPRSSKLLGKRKAMMFDGENEGSDERPLSPIPGSPKESTPERDGESREERDARLRALRRKSGPQVLAEYQQYKGRGRYAASSSKPADKTINSEFEINPVRNDGMAFEFDSVVRDKNERRKLAAGDCIACKEYYEAVGVMPKRAGAPLWRSPPPEGASPPRPRPCKHHHKGDVAGPSDANNDDFADPGADLNAHKQAISRHRHKWAPASTPPDYWNIGFPDTQQVEDINRRAGELHNQKRDAIEQEASREGGRYRKRA